MAHRTLNKGVCHAIDAWSHEVALRDIKDAKSRSWWQAPGTPGKTGTLDLNKIYAGFLDAIAAHNLQKYMVVHKLESDDAVRLFDDDSVSVLHFDGNHSEEASLHDIALWMPKVKSGGFIYFDDTDWRENDYDTTAAAQKMLLDAGYAHVHTENAIPTKTGEWKIFQKPRTNPVINDEMVTEATQEPETVSAPQ